MNKKELSIFGLILAIFFLGFFAGYRWNAPDVTLSYAKKREGCKFDPYIIKVYGNIKINGYQKEITLYSNRFYVTKGNGPPEKYNDIWIFKDPTYPDKSKKEIFDYKFKLRN